MRAMGNHFLNNRAEMMEVGVLLRIIAAIIRLLYGCGLDRQPKIHAKTVGNTVLMTD